MSATGGYYNILIGLQNSNEQDKLLLSNEILLSKLNNIKRLRKYKLKNDLKEIVICIDKYEEAILRERDKEKVALLKHKISELEQQLHIKKLEDEIPTIDDINKTHHLFLNFQFKPFVSIGYEYSKTPISPIPSFGNTVKIKIPRYGDFFNDMVLYIKLNGFKPINPTNKVRYCDFLGHKLIKNVKFIMKNKVIDEYNSEFYNFYYQFHISENKKIAYKKNIGQEIPLIGTLTSDPVYQNFREQRYILNGPQTPKSEHNNVELFIPLLFWFKDPKLAIPNSTFPFGETFIEIELASRDEVCACIDFVNDGGKYVSPTFMDFHLYTNHIYINPEILDIFIKKIGIILIRVHKQQEMILNQTFNEVLLNEFKCPIETLYISFRPITNIDGNDRMDTWHRNSNLTKSFIQSPIIYDTTGNQNYSIGYTPIIYYDEKSIVDKLGLKADNISLYNQSSSLFYNSYLPYQYGKHATTPRDNGSFLFTFNFNYQKYQPNGYLNLTKIRRFYLYYESSVINADNPCKMFVASQALNFLIIQNGDMNLKY